MNPSVNEMRRNLNPDTFKQEVAWFTKGFRQPKTIKTRLEKSASTIDAFQTMIWV